MRRILVTAGRLACTGALLVLATTCSDDPVGPAGALQPGPRASGYPRVYGTWDVNLESDGVVRETGESVHAECGGRLEINAQRDSVFSGTMILRDTCAQFGGIDGMMNKAGDVSALTYTVTVGIGYCEIVSGDRHFYGTASDRTISVRSEHVRRCGDEVTDRTLVLTGTKR